MADCTAETTMRLGEMDEANAASTAAQDSLDACTESQGIYQEGQTQITTEQGLKTSQL